MSGREFDVDGLLSLPSIEDSEARRAAFRRAMASLSQATEAGPSPLDDVPQAALLRAVKVAMAEKWFDDLEFLEPSSAAVALYEIGAALPAGPEKRETGRKALGMLLEGPAEVFAAIAARMALGSRKSQLSGVAFRARVGLLVSAPMVTTFGGRLAYALATRRKLVRDWVVNPATGSLPARRLAARLLERAAVEAARRAREGDELAGRLLSSNAVGGSYLRLLNDREPLVWRHAASARGILASSSRVSARALTEALSPKHSPTEWRRAGVSLAASIATDPENAERRIAEVLAGPLCERDPGLATTMFLGLPIAFALEPEVTLRVVSMLVEREPLRAAEGVLSLAREIEPRALDEILDVLRSALIARLGEGGLEPAESALIHALREEIESGFDGTLRGMLRDAVSAFSHTGTRDAFALCQRASTLARESLETLADLDEGADAMSLRMSVALLRDVDGALLESGNLEDLLQLQRRPSGESQHSGLLEDVFGHLASYLVRKERVVQGKSASNTALAMSSRRLRSLLRLLDSEVAVEDTGDENASGSVSIRARRTITARLLVERLRLDEPTSPLRRTIAAALARGLDAMVRDGGIEPADVLLTVARKIAGERDLATLAEASMEPELNAALAAWVAFSESRPEGSSARAVSRDGDRRAVDSEAARSIDPDIDRLLDLAEALGDDGSARGEGLRALLVRLSRSLESLSEQTTRTRQALVEALPALENLSRCVVTYQQLEAGAMTRVLGRESHSNAAPPLTVAGFASQLGRGLEDDSADAATALAEIHLAIASLPQPIAQIVHRIIDQVKKLPMVALSAPSLRMALVEEPVPAWLGPRRTLGGFYVVKPLGSGAAASVFVAKRLEERGLRDAECFALKVPDYDGAAARRLSEREFMEFFRAEASALLGLPPAPNLARFVTFDLAAKPKPILVMELIAGATLERWLTRASLHKGQPEVAEASLLVLDGIAAGLEVMHQHGLGHLDLKLSNVILRDGKVPTLVDFGLSGRHVRPGCGTGAYASPEVWGVVPDDFRGAPSPMPVDIYAFGAVIFEILTGETLFDGQNELALVSQHCTHDGHPPRLDRLAHVRPMMELLEHMLRRDPRKRWNIAAVRNALGLMLPHLRSLPWPLRP